MLSVAYTEVMTDRPKIDPKTLGQRVVNRRVELGYEQADLALRSGLSRAYISRLENGLVGNPKLFDLELVAEVLDIPLTELVAPEANLVETRYSAEWSEIQRQTENLPPAVRERVLRGYRQSLEIALAASDLARRN